jgi:Tfp pilus assembly protein PilX
MKNTDQNILKSSRSAKSGSALLTAIIFSFVIGALAVTFLKLASSEYRAAVRSTLYASSLNLAESGIEMGVAALADGTATKSSTYSPSAATKYLVDQGFSGDVKYVILKADEERPVIFAEGVISGHAAGDVVKQVRVELSTDSNAFEKGFSTRDGIEFKGDNVLVDSYNSNYGGYDESLDASAPFDYGVKGKNKNDDVYVASNSIKVGETAIDQGNADVYGYVQSDSIDSIKIGKNGMVTTYGDGNHDSSRVLGDFYADFPSPAQPSGTYDATYSKIKSSATITGSANADTPTFYDISEIDIGGGDELIIDGHVVFVMSGKLKTSGGSTITINPKGSLAIYTASNVDIGGNGVVNKDLIPSAFSLYGTANTVVDGDKIKSGQEIKIAGNGKLAAAIYAPAADLTLNGGGSSGAVYGGVVAFSAEVTGGSSFHFDEALRELDYGKRTYIVESWLEMTGATVASTPIDLSKY